MGCTLAEWLTRTTWQAAVLVLIVGAVQLLFARWLAPRWRYALWMLVVVRLLMPVMPASSWSVFNLPLLSGNDMPAVAQPAKPQAAHGVTVTVVRTFDADVELPQPEAPSASAAPRPFDWRAALLAVWLAGAAVLVLRVVVAHVLLARRLRGATPVDEDVARLLNDCHREIGVRTLPSVVATDAVGGPALFGFFRPRLLIPPAMLRELSPDDLRFVFLHELAHLRRRDTLANGALTLANALHWFNPAAWVAAARCRAERELACDAMVLDATAGRSGDCGYGQTMLRLAEALSAQRRRRAAYAGLGMLQSRSQLNRRITMISAFRRESSRSSRWSVLPALLLVGVASCALTDKAASESPATLPVAQAAVESGPAPTKADQGVIEPTRRQESDVDAAAAQLLDRQLPELKLDAVPFSDAIGMLREITGANIFVNWRALEAEGVDRQAPVSARLRNVKFRKGLDMLLKDVGGGTVQLGYAIDDDVLTISTAQDLASDTLTRVYDIRDLISEVPDYAPPTEAKSQPQPAPATQPQASLVEQIKALIQETVIPEAWRDAGGTVGSIRELAGQLVITATEQMHREIATLLGQVREGRGVQVTVEARFITIDPATLDKAMGDRLRGTIGKSGEATAWQVSDDEVRAVLRAVQGGASSSVVTAPRVTLFNGQRGFVTVGTQTAYVAGLTAIKKDGGETRYEPKIDTVQSGITFDVRATASGDRRYATLTLKPKLTRLEALRTIPYMDAKDLTIQVPELVVHELQTTLSIPDRGTALIGGFSESAVINLTPASDTRKSAAAALLEQIGSKSDDAGRAKVSQWLIEGAGPASRPVAVNGDRLTIEGATEFRTTVQVPDGGTLLLSGQIAVPASNLYLLVKPTLIVTERETPKEFPIKSSR